MAGHLLDWGQEVYLTADLIARVGVGVDGMVTRVVLSFQIDV